MWVLQGLYINANVVLTTKIMTTVRTWNETQYRGQHNPSTTPDHHSCFYLSMTFGYLLQQWQ